MPKVQKKPAVVVEELPEPDDLPVDETAAPDPEDREVTYPEIEVVIAHLDRALTAEKAMKLLGWETETDYKERTGEAEGYGEEFLLTDETKEKIQCWNNLGNRPFREADCKKYAQDILTLNWAGPTSMPEETVNGETVIIGKTGRVMSGQHRLIGEILAKQMWMKNPAAYKQYWQTEPVLETIVVFGVSESQKVVKTIDNVIPRTLADTISTADTFRYDSEGKIRKSSERKELSKMLDTAIDLVWKRTHAGDGSTVLHYQTHSASFDFLDRHKSLEKCVKHLFEENSGRAITKLRLSAGHCAGLMYFMASSASDIDAYLAKRDEAALDWSNYDKAEEFWVGLASDSEDFEPIREALKALVDPDSDTGGRVSEKHAVLIKAWAKYSKDEPLKVEDLELEYVTDEDGVVTLNRPWPLLEGIDLGDPAGSEKKEKLSKEEIEEAKKKAREEKTKTQAKKIQKHGMAAGSNITPVHEQMKELHDKHPDRLLIFRNKTGDYNAFCEDAEILMQKVKAKPVKRPDNVSMVILSQGDFEAFVQVLQGLGHKVAVCHHSIDGKEVEVTDLQPRLQPKKVAPVEAKVNGTAKAPPKKTESNGPAKPAKGSKKTPVLKGGTGR